MKTCQACNEDFQELGDWQKICKPCFAKAKRAEESSEKNERARLLYAIGTLHRRISELETELTELKKDNVFSPDFIKKIRVLAHPDKHGGSELSHNVCKVLNGLSQRNGT